MARRICIYIYISMHVYVCSGVYLVPFDYIYNNPPTGYLFVLDLVPVLVLVPVFGNKIMSPFNSRIFLVNSHFWQVETTAEQHCSGSCGKTTPIDNNRCVNRQCLSNQQPLSEERCNISQLSLANIHVYI